VLRRRLLPRRLSAGLLVPRGAAAVVAWMRGGAAEFRDGGGGRVRNTGIGLLGFQLLGPGFGTNGLGRNNSKALYRTNSKNTVFLKRVLLSNV
jgi:hypothetical protein